MHKIITVIGARPQFVKAAIVSKAIVELNCQHQTPVLEELILHSGQHYDDNMSDVFFQEMGIPTPKYRLEMGGLSHGAMTGRMIEEVEKILLKEAPQMVIVFGDTNTTLATSLASIKLRIPIAHIEAGLRSFNKNEPEEINRIVTDQCAELLFTPTDIGMRNLQNEGISNHKIIRVGDVMYDAAFEFLENAKKRSSVIRQYNIPENFILATIHRESNTNDIKRLKGIINGLVELSKEIAVVIPLHPRTKKIASESGLQSLISKHFLEIPPIGYLDMLMLENQSTMIATDSGGIQKEAYFFQKPCITLRNETEWVELVDKGYNRLAGFEKESIVDAYNAFKHQKIEWQTGLYGDGKAGEAIVNCIFNKLKVL